MNCKISASRKVFIICHTGLICAKNTLLYVLVTLFIFCPRNFKYVVYLNSIALLYTLQDQKPDNQLASDFLLKVVLNFFIVRF